jgi:hypothetical protein
MAFILNFFFEKVLVGKYPNFILDFPRNEGRQPLKYVLVACF